LIIIGSVLVVGSGFGLYQAYRNPDNTAQETSQQCQYGTEAAETLSYQGQDNVSALDLLKQNADVKTKTSSIGEYVESINGNDGGGEKFWLYYVNCQQAPVGPAEYVTKESDRIEWRLE
jgi:hypothetical protein